MLRHPETILKEVFENNSFMSRMTPPWLALVHGDLHFNNILLDDRLPKVVRFRLIDPKASRKWGPDRLGYDDPAYDFGKLLQSASGFYDLIHEGYVVYDLQRGGRIQSEGETIVFSVEEWVERALRGGASGAKITTRRLKCQLWTNELFQQMAEHLRTVIDGHTAFSRIDPDWFIRAKFYEALHFLAGAPVHLPDVLLAVSLFARGVEVMNSFWDAYNRGGFPLPEGGGR